MDIQPLDRPLPDDVIRFVVTHIHSVQQLEVLLLVRSRASRAVTADDVSSELRTSHDAATSCLRDLVKRSILRESAPAKFEYAPAEDAVRAAVDSLALLYPSRRYSVIELIFSRPVDPIRAFADAFRVRKDEGEKK